jgi:hypothetical protein
MKVHVEVEGAAESLHEGDGARPGRSCSRLPGTTTLEAEDRAGRCRARGGDEPRVPGEKEARPPGKRENPLAHGHVRQNAIEEVRRGPLRAAGGAGGAEATTLAGKSDQHLVALGGATHARCSIQSF